VGLVEQNQSFKFAGGVETKMDSKAVPPVRLLGLENGVFSKAISIKKRNGYALLSRVIDGTTDLVSNTRALGRRSDELLLFTQNKCYSKQSGADQWVDAGTVFSVPGYDRPAVHTGTAQTVPDHATANGVTVYAWEDSAGGVWWTVVDAVSGRVFKAAAQANAAGQRPRCVPAGDGVHIYYAVPTLNQICVLVVNPITPTAAVTEQIVVEDLDTTNPVYDACASTRTGTPPLLAWHENATTNIRVGFVTAGGVIGSPSNGLPTVARVAANMTAGSPLAVDYFNPTPDDVAYIAYVTAGTGVIEALTADLTIDSGAFVVYATAVNVQRIALKVTLISAWAAFEEAAAQPSNRYTVVNRYTVDGPDTERTIRSVGLASRAFQAGDSEDVFAMFVHDTTYFNTYMTLRLSDFYPVGRHMPGSAAAPARSHLPSVHVSASIATVAAPYKTRLQSSSNDKFTETSVRRIVLDFDSDDSHQYAQLGAGVYMGGACPQHYDGRIWTEQGFNVGPEYITNTVGAGGSLTINSTYEYLVWYEWTDSQGEIHRGPTSVGYTMTTGGADTKATLALPTLRVTQKPNVRICVARCRAGDTSEFFRVASLDPTTAGANNGYVANDKTVDSVSFVDVMSDTTLATQEPAYTTGGILSNDPAALGSHIAASKNRLFFTDANNGNIVRYSQTLATGYGLEIAPELKLDIPPDGGDVTGLSVMDDVVFVFKENAIYAFAGDGPNATGTSVNAGPTITGFSAPQKLPGAAVGCTDPKSIAVTPQGVMFRSGDQGIWRIGIDRQINYTGSPVELYNTQTVRRALPMPDRTAVLFLTDSGSTLYYDYLFDQWSTFTNHEGYDAVVIANQLYYLRTNDVVFQETPGVYLDGTSRIRLRFETAWLHMLEHLQGFQRFWKLLLLGTWVSPHQLVVQYRKDYDEAWSDPCYLDATGSTDPSGWITEYVPSTCTIAESGDASKYIIVRSRANGTAGDNLLFQVSTTSTPGIFFNVDAANNVWIKYKPSTGITWADLADTISQSAYVYAAVNTAGTDLLTDTFQIRTAGGVDDDVFGIDPITGSDYGDGNFGDGDYGGSGPQIYQWRFGIHEDGESIQFRFEDFEKAGSADASFELTEMTIIGGIKKPDIRPFSAARST